MKILFKDKDIVVCIKPVGLLSEEGGMPDELRRVLGGEIYCVHRLDRAVGGLMVYARNKKAASALSALISRGGLEKEYLAVVPDKLKPSDLIWRLKLAMLASVVMRGCVPVLIAYCSAGRPNASHPIG